MHISRYIDCSFLLLEDSVFSGNKDKKLLIGLNSYDSVIFTVCKKSDDFSKVCYTETHPWYLIDGMKCWGNAFGVSLRNLSFKDLCYIVEKLKLLSVFV